MQNLSCPSSSRQAARNISQILLNANCSIWAVAQKIDINCCQIAEIAVLDMQGAELFNATVRLADAKQEKDEFDTINYPYFEDVQDGLLLLAGSKRIVTWSRSKLQESLWSMCLLSKIAVLQLPAGGNVVQVAEIHSQFVAETAENAGWWRGFTLPEVAQGVGLELPSPASALAEAELILQVLEIMAKSEG